MTAALRTALAALLLIAALPFVALCLGACMVASPLLWAASLADEGIVARVIP